jgi:hypothetical protein
MLGGEIEDGAFQESGVLTLKRPSCWRRMRVVASEGLSPQLDSIRGVR